MIGYIQKITFGDLYDIPSRNGVSRPSRTRGSGFKMINMGELFANDRIYDIEMELVPLNIKEQEKFKVLKKDLLFARQSIVAEGAGKCSIVMEVGKDVTCFESHIIRVRLNQELADSLFYYYFFQSDIGKGYLSSIRQQGVQAGIRGSELSLLKLPYLDIKTQRKIASILSAYDDLIENNLKRIKLLEEQAQLTYEEWFVRFKFPGHETTKFDEETGLPEGWEVNKVGSLLGKIKSTKKIKSSEILETGIIPVVDQSRSYIKGFTNEAEALINIDRPIIVFGDHTRVLKFINFPFARGADGTQVILSKSERMPQHLFYFTLKDVDLSNYHYARHFKFLKDSEVIVPTKNIAENFEEIVKKNYDLILNLQKQNQHLKEARDMLLPRLMSGMIDVEKLEVGSLKYEVNNSLGMVAEENKIYSKE